MNLFTWWHHLTDPHCPDCAQENQCVSCDTLGKLLAEERYDKNRLLEQLIELTKPTPIVQERKTIEEKIPMNANMTWKVRRQMLEQADRDKARVIAEQKLNEIKPLTTEELEVALGVSDAGITEEKS